MSFIMQFIRESIESHLRDRGIDPSKTQVVVDEESGTATFLLWNASGQLVGYQRYDPEGSKSVRGYKKSVEGRPKYFTYVADEGGVGKKLAVWGLDTVLLGDGKWPPLFFVVEGVFDCAKIHNAGYPAIAVMTNNPQHLKGWLRAVPSRVVAIRDSDDAGSLLSKIADVSFVTPEPYKDLGDMSQDKVNLFLDDIVKNLGD